jgi:hypothetical protein
MAKTRTTVNSARRAPRGHPVTPAPLGFDLIIVACLPHATRNHRKSPDFAFSKAASHHRPQRVVTCRSVLSTNSETSAPYPPSSTKRNQHTVMRPTGCSMRLYAVRDIHFTDRNRTDSRCPRTTCRLCPAAGSCSPSALSTTSSSQSRRLVFQSASWMRVSNSRNSLAKSSVLR